MTFLYALTVALLSTILIEVTAAFFLGLHKRDILLYVVLVNILTNPAVNVLAQELRLHLGSSAVYVIYGLLEPLVILIEYLCYRKYPGITHPLRTSLILNLLSMGGGIIWQIFL